MSTKQVKLSTGKWPVSEIRPDEWADFFIAHKSPERPYIEKEVLGGVMEKITPPDDHPSWQVYNDEMALFSQLGRHFEWLLGFATLEVPDDWAIPLGKALALGIETIDSSDPKGRKLQYIKHHVLGTAEDVTDVTAATSAIITAEERAAGGEKFPNKAGDETGGVEAPGTDTSGAAQTERADSQL